jgi:hypothetical protein
MVGDADFRRRNPEGQRLCASQSCIRRIVSKRTQRVSRSRDLDKALHTQNLAVGENLTAGWVFAVYLPGIFLRLSSPVVAKFTVTPPKWMVVLGPGAFTVPSTPAPRLTNYFGIEGHQATPCRLAPVRLVVIIAHFGSFRTNHRGGFRTCLHRGIPQRMCKRQQGPQCGDPVW